MENKKIEALVKIRDACTMLAESLNDFIDSQAPKEEKTATYNPEKILWQKTQGSRGEFEKAVEQDTPDYQQLIAHLEKCNGKLTKDGLFYWLFDDKKTVGRKKSNR
jgi:hypothetical protein